MKKPEQIADLIAYLKSLSKILFDDQRNWSFISKIPDYPKPGILFYDISTLISNNYAFSSAIKKLIEIIKNYDFDLVASIDARGFLFGR